MAAHLVLNFMSNKGKLGILVGGGPAPGINGVISSVTIEAVNHGMVDGTYNRQWLLDQKEVARLRFRTHEWSSG